MHNTGKSIFVVSAPSGAGKSTLCEKALAKLSKLSFSVSATTRSRRAYEKDGRDYHFLSREEFEAKIDAKLFLEWEEVHGNLYGTLRSELDSHLDSGKMLLLDLDVKGAMSVKAELPDATTIFIAPPSEKVLHERLRKRGSESEDQIIKRLDRLKMEMQYSSKYDFVIINDDLERSSFELVKIIERRTNAS